MSQKIWLITGISSGLGAALAQTVLEKGDFVVGTFRSPAQAEAFNEQHRGSAFALTLDITQAAQIAQAYQWVMDNFGRLDVLVNNAGYGLAGAIEETSLAEARDIFEANFFGTLQMTQAFLPLFRKQKSGHIIQISSHGGIKAFPGFGLYNASKFALEGFSEALAQEVTPLGIKLTLVEPGPFRTQFAGASFRQSAIELDEYQSTSGAFKARMRQVNGQQEGNPVKAAEAIFEIAQLENPPLRLPLGKIAVMSLRSKLESVQKDLDAFQQLAESTVF
jgi:NAD(P)-dependent dehydrogenase (short-subunit alcohol dehydrogenase family)